MPIVKKFYKMYRAFPDPDYFCLENTYNGNNTFSVTKTGTPSSTDLQYSLDKSTWVDCYNGISNVTVPQGGKVYLRSSTGFSSSPSAYFTLKMTQSHKACGDIRTLFNYLNVGAVAEIPSNGCIYLFNGNTGLTDCYDVDFHNVTSISVTSFTFACQSASNLLRGFDFTQITSVGGYALQGIYQNCSHITTVYSPNVTNWNSTYSTNWLNSVSASGTIYAPTGSDIANYSGETGVPSGWTVVYY